MKKQILMLVLVAGVFVLWQLRVLETAVLALALTAGATTLLALLTGAPTGRHALGRLLNWLERRVAP